MINQANTYNINDPSGDEQNPIFISRRRDAVQIYSRRKTDDYETDFRCSSKSHQPFHPPRMFKRYILSTTVFPSQSVDETGCDYSLFPMPGKKIISPLTFIIRWNTTMESTPTKLIYPTSKKTTTFQVGIQSSNFLTKLTKKLLAQDFMSMSK